MTRNTIKYGLFAIGVILGNGTAVAQSAMDLVWGGSRWTGGEDLSASYSIDWDGEFFNIDVTVTDDVLVFNNDVIHSDHIELWVALPENRYTDQPDGFYKLDDIGTEYWLEPSANGDVFSIPSLDPTSGPNCLGWYFEDDSTQIEKMDQWFGLTHLGFMPSGQVIVYEPEKLPYYDVQHTTNTIELTVSRASDTQYSINARIPIHAVGLIPAEGLHSIRFMIDVIDVDHTGKQESVASSSKTRRWGHPGSFNSFALPEPYVVPVNDIFPLDSYYSDYSESLENYVLFEHDQWRAVAVGSGDVEYYGYDICSASIGAWLASLESTIRKQPIFNTYERTVNGFSIQKINQSFYINGKYTFTSNNSVNEFFPVKDAVAFIGDTNTPLRGRFATGPCAGAVDRMKVLYVFREAELNAFPLLEGSDCGSGLHIPEEYFKNASDLLVIQGRDLWAGENTTVDHENLKVISSHEALDIEFDISNVIDGVINAKILENKNPSVYIHTLLDRWNSDQLTWTQVLEEIENSVEPGVIYELDQCPYSNVNQGIEPWLELETFFNVREVCRVGWQRIVKSLENGYIVEDLEPFLPDVTFNTRNDIAVFELYGRINPLIEPVTEVLAIRSINSMPEELDLFERGALRKLSRLIKFALANQHVDVLSTIRENVSPGVSSEIVELLIMESNYNLTGEETALPRQFDPQAIMSYLVHFGNEQPFFNYLSELGALEQAANEINDEQYDLVYSALRPNVEKEEILIELGFIDRDHITVSRLFEGISSANVTMVQAALRYEFETLPLDKNGNNPLSAWLKVESGDGCCWIGQLNKIYELLLNKFDFSNAQDNSTYFARLTEFQNRLHLNGSFDWAKAFLDQPYTDINYVVDGRSSVDYVAALDNRELLIDILDRGAVSADMDSFRTSLAKYISRADIEVVRRLIDSDSVNGVVLSQFCTNIGYSAGVLDTISELRTLLSCPEDERSIPRLVESPSRSNNQDDIGVSRRHNFTPYWINFTDGTHGRVKTSTGKLAYRASMNPSGTLIALETEKNGPLELYSLVTGSYSQLNVNYGLNLTWFSDSEISVATRNRDQCALYLDSSSDCSKNGIRFPAQHIAADGTMLLEVSGTIFFNHPDGSDEIVTEDQYVWCTMDVTQDRKQIIFQENWGEFDIGIMDSNTGLTREFISSGSNAGCPLLSRDDSLVTFYKNYWEVGLKKFPSGEDVPLYELDTMPVIQ